MPFSKSTLYFACVVYSCISAGSASGFELPDGVSIGATFDDIQVIARSRNWELRQTSFNSNAWSIPEQKVTLYFCDQMLATVDKELNGNLRTFVETVWNLQLKWGEPHTETFVLVPGSQWETYGVQSTFKSAQGLSLTLQIYTRNDNETLWGRMADGSVCELQ
ncbi:MAG: hypothetical protein N4A61_15050 [Pelagimonas sp.]|jgi:hypothetical protein|nr:hypothetical protein [Pelagimonas sp.]